MATRAVRGRRIWITPALSSPGGDRLASPPETVPRCNCIAERLQAVGWHGEDDPPPYASLINASPEHHRVTWSYVFPGLPGYEATTAGTSGTTENRTIARPLVSIPLTSYGIFKIEPPRYAAAVQMQQQQQPVQMPRIMMSEPGPAVKPSNGTARKYGAILIAATVIIFLMALSLMVRFVTEKSLWRG